jgi:hypothetical protein
VADEQVAEKQLLRRLLKNVQMQGTLQVQGAWCRVHEKDDKNP